MTSKRVCILGGSGFVGQHLVARLGNKGISSRVITRHPQRHRQLKVIPGTELVKSNIFDRAALSRQFQGCDAVINLIGTLNETTGQSFHRLHVELVDVVVEACRSAGIKRLLHMSALNASEANGSSHYLRTKGEGESWAHTRGGGFAAVTSFRPSVIFGPGDSFFNRFAGLLERAPLLFPLACAESRFAPVYVGDVVETFSQALDDSRTFGHHYDLCGPRSFSLGELVSYTAQTIGKQRILMELGDSAARLQARVMEKLPGKPFTMDNYLSLQSDSVCDENGLEQLGIKPIDIEAVVPLYLAHQRQRDRLYQFRQPRG